MASNPFRKLALLIDRAFSASLGVISRSIILSMKKDEPFETEMIYSVLDESVNIMNTGIIKIADEKTAEKVLLNNKQRFKTYKDILRESSDNFLFLSDSNKKLINKISNKELQKILIRGGGVDDLSKAIEKNITSRMIDVNNPDIEAARFFDAVKVFNRDGEKRLVFKNKNGKQYSFTPKHYSRLMSESLMTESQWSSEIQESIKKGDNLIKFNSTGTSKESYLKQGDNICAVIDGQIFSVMPSGSNGASGKFYPSIYTVINNKKWLNPHPFCKHRPESYSWRLA